MGQGLLTVLNEKLYEKNKIKISIILEVSMYSITFSWVSKALNESSKNITTPSRVWKLREQMDHELTTK